MTLRGGALRYRIAIDAITLAPNVPDDGGQREVTTRLVDGEPAAVRARTTAEIARSLGVFAEATHDVTVRFLAGVTPAMRITVYGDAPARSLEIRGVSHDERRESLILACVERQ